MSEGENAHEMTIVEMVEKGGMDWPDIARALDTDIDDAMQRYRDKVYDHWDTGWELQAGDGQSRFTSGAVDVWGDGEASVHIEEIRNHVPLTVIVEEDEQRTFSDAELNADQARELARALEECADILEGKK